MCQATVFQAGRRMWTSRVRERQRAGDAPPTLLAEAVDRPDDRGWSRSEVLGPGSERSFCAMDTPMPGRGLLLGPALAADREQAAALEQSALLG